jgi:hypothetical protein
VNLTGTQFTEHLLLLRNVYYRHLITDSSNGSNNDNYLTMATGAGHDCGPPPQDRVTIAYCSQAATRCVGAASAPRGLGVQLTDSQDLGGWKNQAILGSDYSDSDDEFVQSF